MLRTSVFYPQAEVTIYTEFGELVMRSTLAPVGNTSDDKETDKVVTIKKHKEKNTSNSTNDNSFKKFNINAEMDKRLNRSRQIALFNRTLKGFNKDILSIVTKRDIGNDSPTFSINLVYRAEWFYSIASNDLVIIKLCRPPEELKIVMVGLVDDCRRSIDYSDKTPQRAINITGRGLSKAFLNFDIGLVNEVEVSENYLGYIGKEVTIEGCTANEAIDKIIGVYAGNYINYKFADGSNLLDRIHLSLTARPNYKIIDVSGLLNYQGSLWQLLKEIQNSPFNELFWEIDGTGAPTLYLRPTPFDESKWLNLPSTEILDEEYISDTLGRSDLETYTLYSVNCMTMLSAEGQANSFGYLPLWHPPYFPKYGIRRLEAVSLYSMYASDDDAEASKATCLQGTKDLFNWNIKNNSMFNGNITVRGSNRYKVGSKTTLLCEGMEFYVEGVSHIFNIYDSYKVKLSVTRGLPSKERFTYPWGCEQTFDPGVYQLGVKKQGFSSNSNSNDSSGSGPGGSITQGDLKKVLDAAKGAVGTRYELGGNSPETTLDCSGLVCYCYRQIGFDIAAKGGRRSQDMVNVVGVDIDPNDQSKWKPGDILFCNYQSDGPHHVVLYAGNNMIYEASSSQKQVVYTKMRPDIKRVKRIVT